MSDREKPTDSVEQAACRQRTEEEDRAIEMRTLARVLFGAGAREIRLNPGGKPFDLD